MNEFPVMGHPCLHEPKELWDRQEANIASSIYKEMYREKLFGLTKVDFGRAKRFFAVVSSRSCTI